MLLAFLDSKKYGIFTDNILSHETVDPYQKYSLMRLINFNCTSFSHVLLTNEHSLIYNQNMCFIFFFETRVKATIQVLRF